MEDAGPGGDDFHSGVSLDEKKVIYLRRINKSLDRISNRLLILAILLIVCIIEIFLLILL